jgi:3-methyladenine DNA glycosylase AlkD
MVAISAVQAAEEALAQLRANACRANLEGMARYGIATADALGVPMPTVRRLASQVRRRLGRDRAAWHDAALALWSSGVHEARIMATVVEAPELTTREQAEAWALDLDSWDTCDQLCQNVLRYAPFAPELPAAWAARPETLVKRAGLVVAAQLGGKDKTTTAEQIAGFLGIVERASFDERNDVKKAASWALRQIGKRNAEGNAAAVAAARRVLETALAVSPATPESKAARWVARDALRELEGKTVRERLGLG